MFPTVTVIESLDTIAFTCGCTAQLVPERHSVDFSHEQTNTEVQNSSIFPYRALTV